MKKFVSLFLALVMVLAVCSTSFAETTTMLRIADPTTRTYAGYRLLNLTVSLKTGEHHTTHTGSHTDECYNYSYTVNSKYRAILQAEVLARGGNYIWTDGKVPDSASAVTDDQILLYLSNQTSDAGSTQGTLRQVADRVYRAIKAAGMDADANLTGNSAAVDQGYWMFADVTDMDGATDDANSLVLVDTKGQDNITVKQKVAIPSVEKKVKDIDDSEDSNILDNLWHDSADHDIGDVVPFKLTATMPTNAYAYTSYKLVFHDTLADGLTLDPASVKVLMYETKHKADLDTDLNDPAKDVTEFFTVNTAAADCTFEVGCDNVLAINGASNAAFVVYYEATLNDDAVVGAAGNPNTVRLEFSNNPYGEGTGKTEEDKVIVFTYQLIINKIDAHNHPLQGAGFTLYKKTLANDFQPVGDELIGDDMTTFNWKGLDDGDYKLVETTVPAGYNKMADILFVISATHSETAAEPELLTLDGGLMGEGLVSTGAIEKDIVNNTGTVLPETGAEGTVMLITISSLVIMVAAVFMITRKRMSVYEA